MNGLDPNIPLAAVRNQPDMMQQMAGAYKMADAMQQYRERQTQQQDQQTLQAYLQQGGDLNTPEGIRKAMEEFRGKISLPTYQLLQQSGEQATENQLKQQTYLAQQDESKLKLGIEQNKMMFQGVSEPLLRYDEIAKDKKLGKQEADRAWPALRNDALQAMSKMTDATGKPLIPPQQLQQYANATPEQVRTIQRSLGLQDDNMKKALEIKAEEALISERYASAEKSRAEAAKARRSEVPDEIAKSPLHGEQFLGLLSPGEASKVKAIADGRMSLESVSTRGGQRDRLQQLVNQYDPNYSQSEYKTKAAVQKDFTSGPQSKNIISINTSIGHLGELNKLGMELKNGQIRGMNELINRAQTAFGLPAKPNYELAVNAVGDELMKTFRGAGASQVEAEAWKNNFLSASSPEQIKNSVQTAIDLLASRMEAVDNSWKRGMKTDKGYEQLLDPKSVNTLYQLTGQDYSKKFNVKPPSDEKNNSEATGEKTKQEAKQEKRTEKPQPTAEDRAWAKGNPQRTKQFKDAFGVEP